jgi:DNA-3-methyladenine glycosylase I
MAHSSGHGDPHGSRPKRPRSTAGYLEALSRPVFSAGMSWRVVDAKWAGIKDAFLDFNPERVGELTPADVDRLMTDPRVVRNRPKIEATIDNARTMVGLVAEFGSMQRYLAASDGFEQQARDLKRRFRFVGDMGAYQFLWTVGEDVPDWGSAAAPSGRRTAKKTGS